MIRAAHAKVNLVLSVGPVDSATGLHPICSWMHSIALADEISLTPASEPSYMIRWADGRAVDWVVEDDLAVRAHLAVQDYVGATLGVELAVVKRIPDGGGLGGGSSDAAMTILMLDSFFQLGLSSRAMHEIAGALGSDVAFFLDVEAFGAGLPPRTAVVSGVGDVVDRIDRRSMPISLVVPDFGCSTAAVYGAFDQMPTGAVESDAVWALANGVLCEDSALFNDLAEPAMVVAPRLGVIREALEREIDRAVHVSGSGSTLFVFGGVDVDEVLRVAAGCRVIESALV